MRGFESRPLMTRIPTSTSSLSLSLDGVTGRLRPLFVWVGSLVSDGKFVYGFSSDPESLVLELRFFFYEVAFDSSSVCCSRSDPVSM